MSLPLRPPEGLVRAARWTATPAGLTALFAGGLVLRLLLARGGGFPADTAIFQAWSARLADLGPGGFYEPGYFADYPPGYLYVLWPMGVISKALFAGVPPVFIVKLPGMLADIGLAWVVMSLATVAAAAAGHERWWVRPAAASAILFNPPIVFLSAVWGQVDTVAALYALGGLLLIVKGAGSGKAEAGGAALFALAFATKPQTGFLIPVVALVLVMRHLRRDDDTPADPVRIGARLAVPAVSFLAVLFALALPFGLSPPALVDFYQNAGSVYPYTSVWAFNFWGLVGFWRPDSGPDAVKILGTPAFAAGAMAFGAGAAYAVGRAFGALRRKRSEVEVLLVGGAAIVCLSFAVLTRIHERYLFLGLACLAPLIFYPIVRAVFAALTLLFMLNLYFPWVYYVEQAGRTTLKFDAIFRLFYGTVDNSIQKKLLGLVTGALCILVLVKLWDYLRPPAKETAPETPPEREPAAHRSAHSWSWTLHPIGRKGAALAAVVFLVLVPTRLAGLGSPQGMYFDEIYHARTAGEFVAGKESYEWTHPPLGKELMALSLKAFSGWDVQDGGSPPAGLGSGTVDSDGKTVAWGAGDGTVSTAGLPGGCTVGPVSTTANVPFSTDRIALASTGGFFVAGSLDGRFFAGRYVGEQESWRTRLDAAPVDIAAAGDSLYVVDESGELLFADSTGALRGLSSGASAVTADADHGGVWVAFPSERTVSLYDGTGTTLASVTTYGSPDHLVAVPDADRVLTLDRAAGLVESIDNQQKTWIDQLDIEVESLESVPTKGLAYVLTGRDVQIIEPRGLTVIGSSELPSPPSALIPVATGGLLMAAGDDGLDCVTGDNEFAYRLPGALFGALLPALVLLLALRLTGSRVVAGLAAAFVALEGLAFSISRIAILDSQATALIVLSWLAAVSVAFHAHRVVEGQGRRLPGLLWFAGTGVALGLSIATKWVGLYSFGLLVLLFFADLLVRGDRGVAALFPNATIAGLAVVGGILVLPLTIYVASYIPYFSLGHSFGELARLQKGMYDYHANLEADHPYSSPWYGWPFGHRAVALYSVGIGSESSQIWAAANPVVLVGGLVGMVVASVAGWRRKSLALLVLPIAALVQFLPWTIVSRVVFLYHYLPVVPFLAIALAWTLVGREGSSRYRVYEAGIVVAAAAAVFAFTLPELDGWSVSLQYHSSLHEWLPWLF